MQIGVEVQNVGPGPALNNEVSGWLRVPDPSLSPEDRRAAIQMLKRDIDITRPELHARPPALSPGDIARINMTIEGSIEAIDSKAEGAILLYTCKYQDVFENTFPRKPIDGTDLGHASFA